MLVLDANILIRAVLGSCRQDSRQMLARLLERHVGSHELGADRLARFLRLDRSGGEDYTRRYREK